MRNTAQITFIKEMKIVNRKYRLKVSRLATRSSLSVSRRPRMWCVYHLSSPQLPRQGSTSYPKGVTTDVAVSIATTVVGAQLDYCDAILYGTSKSNIQK